MCVANQRCSRCRRKTSARHGETGPTPPLLPNSTRKARLFRVQILTAALVRDAATAREWVTILGLTRVEAQELTMRTGLRFMHHDPRIGFENYPDSFEQALRFIEDNPARLTFLAVGPPRQEMVAQALAARGIATGTALCVGASLAFLAGVE